VASDGSARVVDFESSGWDHPLSLCVDFLTHDQSLGLDEAAGAASLAAFRAGADLPPGAFSTFEPTRALMHVFWCAVHLSSLDPAHLARRRFLRQGLDVEAHAAEQMAKFRRRLDLLERLLG